MMDKSIYYNNYVSTHTSGRKQITNTSYEDYCKVFNTHFLHLLPPDRSIKILDIGCGNGTLIYWLSKNGYSNSFGIDISAEQISQGLENGIINIQQADLEEYISDKKEYFDVIFAKDVLEHFSKSELLPLLQKIRCSLKETGSLIIQVPNAESPLFGRVRYGDMTHEIAFNESSIKQLFRNTGFNQVECFEVNPIFLTVKSWLARFLLWKTTQLMFKLILFAEAGKPFHRIVTQNIIAKAYK